MLQEPFEPVPGSELLKKPMAKYHRSVKVFESTSLVVQLLLRKDETLWHPQLASTKPSKLFMTLLDYSKDDSNDPQTLTTLLQHPTYQEIADGKRSKFTPGGAEVEILHQILLSRPSWPTLLFRCKKHFKQTCCMISRCRRNIEGRQFMAS